MTRLVILDRSVRVIFHAVLVGSIYLLFAGHNQPGGGFVGGLVAGAAVAIQYVAGGMEEVRHLARFQPWTILGTGLLLAAGTALTPLLLGGAALEASYLTIDGPLPSAVKVTSSLFFDVGVYLLVLGLVLMIFEAFGDEPPTEEELVPRQATPTTPDTGQERRRRRPQPRLRWWRPSASVLAGGAPDSPSDAERRLTGHSR